MAARILEMLAATGVEEMGCDDCFQLLDQFADLQMSSADASEFLPLVHKHLQMCGDCREEYEILLSMVAMDMAN